LCFRRDLPVSKNCGARAAAFLASDGRGLT
jgi:hypothetical protein